MSKRTLTLTISALLALTATTASAVPAKKGVWQTRTLSDGQKIEVQLHGDETLHYWVSADGRRFVANADGRLRHAADGDLSAGASRRHQATDRRAARRAVTRMATHGSTSYTGQKRGLIILVQFRNKQFKSTHTQQLYNSVANEEGFTSAEGFVGSVYDYFLEQSGGLLELTFDVVGPVTLSHDYAYYGKDSDGEGNDAHPGEMVVEACRAIQNQVNFRDYDWDGDGEVDQVVVLYAGEGQADGGSDDTIWPHEYVLQYSDYGRSLFLKNMRINTYACVNELAAFYNDRIDGIGTLCHEFSHCLGLMDAYDTNGKNFGMGEWSPMCYGCYNGKGFRPAGYTAFEKMSVGWLAPIELSTGTSITGMKPMSQQGDAYYIDNDGHTDEFYMLEYRERTGWDTSLPGRGLLITHIDYDDTVWWYNEINTTEDTFSENDHQRFTIFPADNNSGTLAQNMLHDPYPYGTRDSLTNNSTPKATLHNANSDGGRLMNKGIYNIRFEDRGTMAFDFRLAGSLPSDTSADETTLFYESFNRCNGIGGNDNIFNGSTTIGARPFLADVTGWTYSTAAGCNACARFGSAQTAGEATTPPFTIDGSARLSFKAAPWGNDGTSLTLKIDGEATVSPSVLTMRNASWTEFTASLDGTGTVRLTFAGTGRLFLDEVKVTGTASDGIHDISNTLSAANKAAPIYHDLTGRRVNAASLRPNTMYIHDGKKYLTTKPKNRKR